jgi:hypothetical protein
MEIPLHARDGSVRAVAHVDDDRTDLAALRWSLLPGGYVVRYKKIDGKQRCFYLHREVMDAPPDMHVDHRDYDPLNCRRENLRLCTRSENMSNRRGATARSKSGIRGVYYSRSEKCWIAKAQYNGLHWHAGFANRDDAAAAVARWRSENMPYSKEAQAA